MDDSVVGAPAEVVTEAPVTETPEPTPEVKAIDAEPQSRADVLREAFNKPSNRGKHAAYQPREQGKFAPGAPLVPKEQPVEVQRPPMPKSLRKELEPHWQQAPKELIEAFIQRDLDAERGITQYKSKAEQADALLSEFQPYEWLLRQEGATPQSAVKPLLQTAALLRTGTPAQKAQAVAQTMQQFGIPLEHIASLFGQGHAPASLSDPSINALHQEVQNLRQFIAQTTQQQEQGQTQRALSVIKQFSADPKNAHLPQVQDAMMAILQSPQRSLFLGNDFEVLSEREKLDRAYAWAVRQDPQLSQQIAAQQQADAERERREKAQQAANVAKAAAVQVRGAPGAPPQPAVNSNDRRSVIANALRAANA